MKKQYVWVIDIPKEYIRGGSTLRIFKNEKDAQKLVDSINMHFIENVVHLQNEELIYN